MKNLRKIIFGLMIFGIGLVSVPVVAKAADGDVALTSADQKALSWSVTGGTFLENGDTVTIEGVKIYVAGNEDSGRSIPISTTSMSADDVKALMLDTNPLSSAGTASLTIKAKAYGKKEGNENIFYAAEATGPAMKNICRITATPALGDTGITSCTATPEYGWEGDSCTLSASITDTSTYYFDKWSNSATDSTTTVTFSTTGTSNAYTASSKKKVTGITSHLVTQMLVNGSAWGDPEIAPADSGFAVTDIEWSVTAGTNIATCSKDSHLGRVTVNTNTNTGNIVVTATITNGLGTGTPYTQDFPITVIKPVTAIAITSPNSVAKTAALNLTASVTPTDATYPAVTWSLPSGTTGASISGSTFTATNTGTYTVTATATNNGYGAPITQTQVITVTDIKPVTDITGVPTDITVGYELALSGSNYPTVVPSDATNKTITWSVKNQNSTNAAINDSKFKATSAGTATITATITNGTATGNYTKDFTITVHKAPTISYDTSNRSLTVSLPEEVVTGYGNSSNITEVTGGYLEVFYNGSSVYNSGTTYQSSGKSFTVSASNVESIISSLSSKFSGTTSTIEFRITPVGHTASNTSGYERSSINGTSGSVTVYQISVGGANITSATYYGLAGSSLKITATPASGYSFTQWSDGNTSNPRTVTVSSTTASNGYAATAVLGANRSSSATAGGTGSGGSGGTGNYDAVPKTGEGNAVLWMMAIAILSGAAAMTVLVRRIMKKEPQTVQAVPTEKQDDFDIK